MSLTRRDCCPKPPTPPSQVLPLLFSGGHSQPGGAPNFFGLANRAESFSSSEMQYPMDRARILRSYGLNLVQAAISVDGLSRLFDDGLPVPAYDITIPALIAPNQNLPVPFPRISQRTLTTLLGTQVVLNGAPDQIQVGSTAGLLTTRRGLLKFFYPGPAGGVPDSLHDGDVQRSPYGYPMVAPVTVRRLRVNVLTTQPGDTATLTLMRNGVATSIVVASFGASTTILSNDNEEVFQTGDVLDLQLTGGSPGLTFSATLETGNDIVSLASGGVGGPVKWAGFQDVPSGAIGLTRYADDTIIDGNSTPSMPKDPRHYTLSRARIIRNVKVRILFTSTLLTNLTFTLMRNGAPTPVTTTLAAGIGGITLALPGSQAYNANDTFDLRVEVTNPDDAEHPLFITAMAEVA